jgi:glycosyltransferase involved in cell wall biosynthesis
MTRILVVAEASRSIGEFRRPWVRALYGAYLGWYRRVLATSVARLAPGAEMTLLAGREFVDRSRLPDDLGLRFYDEESYKTDSRTLSELTRRLVASWWPPRGSEPLLFCRGVWLPDLLPVAKGILLRLEVIEYLGVLEQVLDQFKPDRVVLVTGASVPERLARGLALERAFPVEVAARFLPAFVVPAVWRGLRTREERRTLRTPLAHRWRKPPLAGNGSRFLFSACQARHLDMAETLVLSLRENGGISSVVVSGSDIPEMDGPLRRLEKKGVAWADFMDYLPASQAHTLVQEFRRAARGLWRRLERGTAAPARLRHGDVALGDVITPFARNAVRWSLVTARLYLEAAFRALEAQTPRAVVIASDRRFPERALALAARELGIPCVLFSAALILGRDRASAYDIGDRILVMGEHLREALVKEEGIDPRRISVVGDPRSDAARLLPRERLRGDVLRDFDLSPDRPLIVVVSKYVSLLFSIQEKEALYRTVFAAARILGDPNVVVKVHPNEDLTRLREQLRDWGCDGALLTQDYDIHRLFGAADAAIMVTSMAAIEAMAMGCPVVAVQTPGKDFEGEYMPPYVSEGVVERVDMGLPTALAATLTKLLTDSNARATLVDRGTRFAAHYIRPADGRFANRLLSVVEEVRREIAEGRSR